MQVTKIDENPTTTAYLYFGFYQFQCIWVNLEDQMLELTAKTNN